MATRKKIVEKNQELLADALFPQDDPDDFEDAILTIPPEKRILRTDQYDFSVSTLVAMMEKGEVKIPEFQRRYVWTDRQASRLIESLIIQCPIPVIYLNQDKDETFSVIDGNQRLTSLRNFLGNKFSLSGLTSYPELTGCDYSQLDSRFQRHINNRVVRCTVILKETHPQVKFDVFERLNSGAVALTRQELRHGLFYGTLLKKAASVASELKLETHFGKRKDKRMKAEELVLRYWSLRQNIDGYEKPLATFITNFAESNRDLDEAALNDLANSFRTAYSRASTVFGPHCFTYVRNGTSRFNAAVFDAQMVTCSLLSIAKYAKLTAKKASVQEDYRALQKDEDYLRSITLATSDKAAVHGRIAKVANLLKRY